MRVGIIRPASGNLGSIENALRAVGAEAVVLEEPPIPASARAVILPGVGRFDRGVAELRARGWTSEILRGAADEGKAILGICLGMQLLGSWSEEGDVSGLALIPGAVRRLPEVGSGKRLRVPHMGWAELETRKDELFDPIGDETPRYYFVHSYSLVPEDEDVVAATCDRGVEFVAAVRSGLVRGVQFHPEKSHRFGLALLRRWVGSLR